MDNKYMIKNIPIRFFVITFIWAWAFFAPLFLAGIGFLSEYKELILGLKELIKVIACFGPAVGAIVSIYTLNGKDSLKKYISSFLSIKFGTKIWILIFSIAGIFSISWIIPELFGFPRLKSSLSGINNIPTIFVFIVFWIICVLFGGGQEEIGWRGYVMPFLENKYGYITGSLILGIIWTFWHLPLFFIPGTIQSQINFFCYMLLLIGYSYFFSWIINLSKNKLLSGLIAHGTVNAFFELFPPVVNESNDLQIRLWILSILTFVVGGIIVITRTMKYKSSPNVV
ncbi:MAG: CPBP family intramembrane metalloprotease [Tannerellaceae bacterium]|jgi:membrane protease YdiL (CAAX protease family)|nr:CPBP family intramembrane metalloprotease [Tannerellaceae bacterium]